ncbi:hypothetical protein MNBD_GAMMA22-1596 [hydrothermal vent metagenome]|uniref:Alpha-2-macroglobulin n=1 Tax=hydrothermal vent metagenome TaxID=652676 RepID=A0A3B1AFH7_9ZZZZ
MVLLHAPVLKLMLAYVLVSMLLLSGCDFSTGNNTNSLSSVDNNPQWSQFITSHTAGAISKNASIHIRFVNDIVASELVGKDASSVFKVSPNIQGTITYANSREIILQPASALNSNSKFKVSINTNKLLGLESAADKFTFAFQVIRQDFEVNIDGLNTDFQNKKQLELRGSIVTADVEQAERIEKMLQAEYLNNNYGITWQHSANGKRHDFKIADIPRKNNNSNLLLKWNAAVIGVNQQGEQNIEIPALGLFKVIKVQAVQADRQYVKIQFSDVLKANQDISGLVQMPGVKFSSRIDENAILLYPVANLIGDYQVLIEPGIKNFKDLKITKRFDNTIKFSSFKPQVKFSGKGVILPDNDILSIPFEAVNVTGVQVTAFQVFEKNIGQFLQTNQFDGTSEINRVGRYLWRKTIALDSVVPDKWNRYSLDASELLKAHPGGLFRLTLSINRGNSSFTCPEDKTGAVVKKEKDFSNSDEYLDTSLSGWGYAQDYYGQSATPILWGDRENPCKDAYYFYASGVTDSRNFIASNIGIIAKRDKRNKLTIITSDIRTSQAMSGVVISVRNFQGQEMAQLSTNSLGMVSIELNNIPFYLVASKGKQKAYLKLSKGTALATSHFNVGGQQVDNGLKGFIYGERGVWRPGDNIFLTFVLQDKDNTIPTNHPVTMRLYSPKGQLVQTISNNKPMGDFYSFTLKTSENSETGNWTAKAQLGGTIFSKRLKIETVIPNRLKIDMDFGTKQLSKSSMPFNAKLFSQWLHGAKASNLKYDVEVKVSTRRTRFDTFTDFVFDDPAGYFNFSSLVIAEGKLDAEGNANVQKSVDINSQSPGMLTAKFTTRVFEQGGDFSTDSVNIPFSPYENYVGIKLPKGDATRNMLLTDTQHKVEIASLDQKGKKVSLKNIQVTLYKIQWKWWWDKSGDALANYSSSYQTNYLQQSSIATNKNGLGVWQFEVKYPDWGRYLIRACDLDGKHCTGKTLYMDWPGWAGKAREGSATGANSLSVTTDKPKYQVGDTAVIRLPKASKGRALISIENGTEILQQHWLQVGKTSSDFNLKVTAEMAPNVYIHVSLIQPHQNKKNDRPIRLYGVIPLFVNDPKTRLTPQLTTADEWAPKQKVEITVKEANGKPMTYTIAVVDEGLLGITRFKTPDLHKQFYKKEAHGILTWDFYDFVVGAYGGELERLLALGGGDESDSKDKNKDKKRFPPVVQYLGPFQLKAGATAKHHFKLPQYIGAVRVMLVAGNKTAYGKASKSVFVRESLSILATVPRVIGPDEEMTLPVAIFVMDEAIKDVTLKIIPDEHFEVIGADQVGVHFETTGDKLGVLSVKVKSALGRGHIRFIASSANKTTETEVYLDIRSANPETLRQVVMEIKPGKFWQDKIIPHGLLKTNKVTLELSSVLPINLESRLNYLIRYPHGCIEQVTSSVFPQLYLEKFVKLDKPRKQAIDTNINAAIKRLQQFQNNNGSFSYWPGGNGAPSVWGGSYAGHFLLEAQQRGYFIPEGLISNWLSYQAQVANNWLAGSGQSELEQAYRLYTLALANKAEMGAMNRLRESSSLTDISRWQLAHAYEIVGQSDAAAELLATANTDMPDYANEGITFGSRLRDQAIVLNALIKLGRKQQAKKLADVIATQLSSSSWQSTQSVAYALLAMSNFVTHNTLDSQFTFTQQRAVDAGVNAKKAVTQSLHSSAVIYQKLLSNFNRKGETIKLENTSVMTLYGNISVLGIPKSGAEQATAQGLSLAVTYKNSKGEILDVSKLPQGSDIVAVISVKNTITQDLTNLALTHIIPSGWQIHNKRLNSDAAVTENKNSTMDYQDIRDDRLYSYFALKAGEQKQFTVAMNASYLGRFYLPSISVAAMYDATKNARTKGQWIRVVKSVE